LAPRKRHAKIRSDARHAMVVAYGLCALLTLGADRTESPRSRCPELDDTALMARAGFFITRVALRSPRQAPHKSRGGDSGVERALDITPITRRATSTTSPGRVKSAPSRSFNRSAPRDEADHRLTMTLLRICQNILEHAGPGWMEVSPCKRTAGRSDWSQSVQICRLRGSGSWISQNRSKSAPGHLPGAPGATRPPRSREAVIRGVSRFVTGVATGSGVRAKYVGRWEGSSPSERHRKDLTSSGVGRRSAARRDILAPPRSQVKVSSFQKRSGRTHEHGYGIPHRCKRRSEGNHNDDESSRW